MSKCRECGKVMRDPLAHWRTAHRDLMARRAKSPAARAKAAATRARHAAKNSRSTPTVRSSRVTDLIGLDQRTKGGTWHPFGCRCEGCR